MLKKVNNILLRTIVVFVLLIFVVCIFSFSMGHNKRRQFYNMNVSESIKLSSIYADDNVNWEASNDNVTVSYDKVIANKVGKSIISALDNDGKILFEATINVLGNDNLSADSHSVNLKLKQNKKIVVNNNVMNSNGEEEDLDDDKFSSVVIYEDDLEDEKEYSYSSSNEEVVDVDDEGNLEPVSSGEAIVTVSDEQGNEDYVHVNVEEDDIDLYSTEYDLNVGDILDIDYFLNSVVYDVDDITWSSDNTSVVVVDNKGCVRAINSGSAYVTVKVGDTIEKKILINVLENSILPEDIELSTYKVDVKLGDVFVVNSVVYPYSANSRDVSWKSSNEAIATVINGVIEARGIGSTIITVMTENGIKKEVEVNVKGKTIEVDSIDIVDHVVDIKVGDISKIDYKILPEDADDKTVKYIYDKEYLIVSDDGSVEAIKEGSTVLSVVTANGKKDEVLFNIYKEEILSEFIELKEKNIEVEVGNTSKIEAKVINSKDEELLFTSSNSEIVEVLEDGTIKGISNGSAIVNVSVKNNSNIKTSCYVKVKDKEVTVSNITLNYSNIDLIVGDNKILVSAIVPSNANNKNIKWISSNPNVVTVSNGNVKAVGAGSAVVSAISEVNDNIRANCVVNVKNKVISVSGVIVNKNNLVLTEGNSSTIVASISPSNATNKSIRWISSNPNVVTVNNGNVKAVGVGSAVVSAVSGENANIHADCVVTVKSKVIGVTSIVLDKANLKLAEGNSSTVKATVFPSNATNKRVKWVSSNSKVVTVDNGSIKAVGAGSAVVSAISISNSNIVSNVNITVEKKITNKERFINSLDSMSKQVKKDKKNGKSWKYGGTRRGTFANARKNGRTIDCALYASYALVDIGILDSKSRFFKRAENKIIYDGSAKSKMEKHLTYISGNGKKVSTLIKEGKLQKGDIVLWYNHQHTNVYAGNKKWYDAGRWQANGASSSAGGKFKTLGPVSIETLNKEWKVWKILRVKD